MSTPTATPLPPSTTATTESAGATVTLTVETVPPAQAPADQTAAIRSAGGRIAPLWSLEAFVAVNPYFGIADRSFEDAAELLATVAGARATLPAGYYLDAVEQGRVTDEDLVWALAQHSDQHGTVADFLTACRHDADATDVWAQRVPTVARVASDATGKDWTHLMVDRVSAWAAAHADSGQALWRTSDPVAPLYRSWLEEATLDRTPDVMGLRGFRAFVATLPEDPEVAADLLLQELAIPAEGIELYLHALLLQVGGWAAHVARGVFEQHLAGNDDDALAQFTTVLLAWEVGILRALEGQGMGQVWAAATSELDLLGGQPPRRAVVSRHLVLQTAFDRAEQRRIVAQLNGRPAAPEATKTRPQAQAAFCIDVRSEVFRRHLEAAAPRVDTVGFAGFFGFPIAYEPLAHETTEGQLPVLLTPAYTVAETVGDPDRRGEAIEARRLDGHVRRAWKSFKMGAISCFSFVGPVGLAYLPKLFTDSYGQTRPHKDPRTKGLPSWASSTLQPTLDVTGDVAGIPEAARIDLAEGVLRAMSLTTDFAPVVFLCGHGATTTNNPYDSGLACGACGGHAGEANARVAVTVFNDPAVRTALRDRGITIPDDTVFVAGQHDTTTDVITVFGTDQLPAGHQPLVADLAARFAEAGTTARIERGARLGLTAGQSVDQQIARRSNDWAQVRPEWGLAGCRAFIAAPRSRTSGLDLEGRSFLHSYDWQQDEGFGVLELIMTAPVVVASWISLQYYASTVDNDRFGSGNKVLHNVVGRLGVFEGTAGDLRTGLPWQSVHDGESLQHEPLRMNVIIEAPMAAMDDIIAKHDHVRHLVDNGWMNLLAMGDGGIVTHRFQRGHGWEPVATA